MATLKDKLLEHVELEPGLTDREVADRLLGRAAPQQGINQVARQLASVGRLVRRHRQDGKIGNCPANAAAGPEVPVVTNLDAQYSDF